MAQKGKSKISWITQRRNISSKPNYRQQEDHQVQTAENTVNGTAKIPSFNDPNNYYHSGDESLWASLTNTDSFGSTPVVQSDEWHPPEIGEKTKATSGSEAANADHHSNPDWTHQCQFKLPTKVSNPPTTQPEKYSSLYPSICSEFKCLFESDRKSPFL